MIKTAQETLDRLKPAATKRDDEADLIAGVGGDESVSEAIFSEIFSAYEPRYIKALRPDSVVHPGDIAEAASLSAIQLPDSHYPLWDALPEDVVKGGKLSQLQLEGVLCACTKHQSFLPSQQRAGFFIGDGAGVGKGRQIAGIILDNWARGRRRHVWLSTSSDLHLDAERDLRALGLHIPVINNCQHLDRETRVVGLSQDLKEGVLFMTYSTLVMLNKGKSRLQQVIDWVGGPEWDGCLVFDEAHKAKNFVPGKEGQSTKVATTVLEIQNRLPKSRVVYCSATGVSEVGNMAYMTRLGLWGPGSAFPDFNAFLESMKKRGVSFLEMLAMEMKSEGYYVARGLSFRQAEFLEMECSLTPEQISMYNDAVAVWQDLKTGISDALVKTGASTRDIWKFYWAAQQRFFKLLCISVKIPTVVKEAKKALADGFAVVIGLQSTGEASADALGLQPGEICGFVSVARELLTRFIKLHFPVRIEDKQPQEAGAKRAMPPRFSRDCVARQKALLERVHALPLPPNFLDELVDRLGGPANVAEMTGRRGRVVRDPAGRGVFQLRARPDSTEMDSLNVTETAAFMKGEKLVAIVSDAASTGISLHAAQDAGNKRRRMHLTIELPWSADKAIQQLGRSHRSNQVSAPIYKLVVSSIGGEKRFAAAVARRLQSLGALTRADRRAASGLDLSESNFDSPLGRKSLRRMYDGIVQESPILPAGVTLADIMEGCLTGGNEQVLESLQKETFSGRDYALAVIHLHRMLRDCVDMMGVGATFKHSDTIAEDVTSVDAKTTATKDLGDVRRFLNRLLGLPIARQNLLFNYFAVTLTAEIRSAKAEGRYFEGVSDLPGAVTRVGQPQVLWVDQYGGLKTMRHDLSMDRGLSFEAACAKLEHEAVPGDQSGWRRSRRPMFGHVMYMLAIQKRGMKNLFVICRPNTGVSYFEMEADELENKYEEVSKEEAESGWTQVFQDSLEACMHGPKCAQGPDCQVGKRQVPVTILAGSVVRVWAPLESVLSRHEGMLSKSDRTMRVVRVDFDDAETLIGVRYPAHLLPEVVAALTAAQLLMPPPQILNAKGMSKDALEAAAMGAVGAVAVEPPTPVDRKSLAKALRPPRSILSFFSKAKSAPAFAAVEAPKPLTTPLAPKQEFPSQTANAVIAVTASRSPPCCRGPDSDTGAHPQVPSPPGDIQQDGVQTPPIEAMEVDARRSGCSGDLKRGPCENAIDDPWANDSDDPRKPPLKRAKAASDCGDAGPNAQNEPTAHRTPKVDPHSTTSASSAGFDAHMGSASGNVISQPCVPGLDFPHLTPDALGATTQLLLDQKAVPQPAFLPRDPPHDTWETPPALPSGASRDSCSAEHVKLEPGHGSVGADEAGLRPAAVPGTETAASHGLCGGSIKSKADRGFTALPELGTDIASSGGTGSAQRVDIQIEARFPESAPAQPLSGTRRGSGTSGTSAPKSGERGPKGLAVRSRGPGGTEAVKTAKAGLDRQSHEEHVSTLMAMGFTALQVERALKVTQGDLERAANWLLVGM